MKFYSKWHMKLIMGHRFKYANNVKICFPITVNHTMRLLLIGNNVTINGNVEIFGKGTLIIHDNVIISKFCHIITATHGFDKGEPVPCGRIQNLYTIRINKNCWICTGVTLLGNITIQEGCIIGAGAILTKSTISLGVYAGNPAKLIRNRNPKRYEISKSGWEYDDYE